MNKSKIKCICTILLSKLIKFLEIRFDETVGVVLYAQIRQHLQAPCW